MSGIKNSGSFQYRIGRFCSQSQTNCFVLVVTVKLTKEDVTRQLHLCYNNMGVVFL